MRTILDLIVGFLGIVVGLGYLLSEDFAVKIGSLFYPLYNKPPNPYEIRKYRVFVGLGCLVCGIGIFLLEFILQK
jgi:hypothetical protein